MVEAKKIRHYIAGLDGLRALAVIFVVAYHLFPPGLRGGYIGVDIFFVISGFLITTLLIDEHSKQGSINLVRFWQRRARRLLPALFATIAITCSVALFIRGDILVGLGRQVLGAATFSNNWVEIAAGSNYFDATTLHLFTNFWSLAVEEQFYAVWPFVVVAILSIAVVTKRYRTGLWLGLMLSIVSAGWMYFLFNGDNATRVYYGSDTHAFGLMLGATLAFWGNVRYTKAVRRKDPWPSARFKRPRLVQGVGVLSILGLGVLAAGMSEQSAFAYRGGLLLASCLSGAVIIATVSSRGLLQRLFELTPLKWIGERSYGIYLWHWPIIVLLHYALPADIPLWAAAVTACVSTVLIAATSYRYLEVPVRTMGLRAFVRKGIVREVKAIDNVTSYWKVRVHPAAVLSLVLVGMTIVAIVAAPAETQAQRQIQAGEAAVASTQPLAHPARSIPTHTKNQAPPKPKPAPHKPITGSDISLVGDSVALASAPELQAKFPGIYIDAKVSRSMRGGGLETIENLLSAGTMRRVLIVALGTNGYFGDGNVPRLMNEVGPGRQVIFVTAHAPDEWSSGNNQYLHSIVAKYPNMHIAEWDTAISAHPDELGPDGIHPGAEGGALYANCIATAINQIK